MPPMSSLVVQEPEKSLDRGDQELSLLQSVERQWENLVAGGDQLRCNHSENSTYVLDDAIHWLAEAPECCLHAIVTDPPYALVEYSKVNLDKKRSGRGGVWRIPPSFDGARRNPLPRFTTLNEEEIAQIHRFLEAFAYGALRSLVPGGHMLIASNPLVSTTTFHALQEAGFEKRGEIIRLVQILRGGDRPKGAESDFPSVTVMPRSCWEPWGVFRKPFRGTVADNLRKWGAGGMRRTSALEPFKDVIRCSPTRSSEKRIAPHPSLKPQKFLRRIVRAVLPLGVGIAYDPFAGSGSTLAAAQAVGYRSIGTDHDLEFFDMSRESVPKLAALKID